MSQMAGEIKPKDSIESKKKAVDFLA